eukprot:TRINITY_DN799_c0_g1_i1.p1 TRINITY_DN799_c0_g1~~TRINITY_DN799_c0_g1_i1.p1  ORF type:complete len:280 (+),score=57.03 TRINITY_DN799_c0_g1_i1:784-1623(+)
MEKNFLLASQKKERQVEAKITEAKEVEDRSQQHRNEEAIKAKNKKELYKMVQQANLDMMRTLYTKRQQNRNTEIALDRSLISEQCDKMKKQEEKWKNEFRKRLVNIERVQRNLTPLMGTRSFIEIERSEDQRVNKEKEMIDSAIFIKEKKKKEEREKRKKEFLDSIRQIIQNKDHEKWKRKRMIKEQSEILCRETMNNILREKEMRDQTRKKALDYSYFLEKQIKEKRQKEWVQNKSLSPHEVGMNKDFLKRIGAFNNISQFFLIEMQLICSFFCMQHA